MGTFFWLTRYFVYVYSVRPGTYFRQGKCLKILIYSKTISIVVPSNVDSVGCEKLRLCFGPNEKMVLYRGQSRKSNNIKVQYRLSIVECSF